MKISIVLVLVFASLVVGCTTNTTRPQVVTAAPAAAGRAAPTPAAPTAASPAAKTATAAADDRMICEMVHVVGSNRPKRICLTASQRERMREQAAKELRRCSGSNCSGG